MNSSIRQIRIAELSDIHLGHRRNKTEDIITNLNKYFSNTEFLSKVDLVLLAGDVFDDLLGLGGIDTAHIQSWISRLLKICTNLGIVIRVLEGTPSHDRGQSLNFLTISEILKSRGELDLDLKYINTLCIEHIDKFGIDVLYVPDEYNHDNHDTYLEVQALLKSKMLSSVDLAVMHGCFEYQIPEITKSNIKHDSRSYLDMVSGLIFIGHVHKASQFERIYAAGSFDRLAHNEEEAKGFLYAILNHDNSSVVKFIENKDSKKFITIKAVSEDMENNLKRIDKRVLGLPVDSFVRIETKANNPMVTSLETLKARWPFYNWNIVLKDKEDHILKPVLVQEFEYVPVIINPETLRNLVAHKLKKMHLSADVLERCMLHVADMEKL